MSCEPDTLLNEANCLAQCIPQGMQDEVQTYLLSAINGGETDPNALMRLSKEYNSKVPPGMHQAPQVYLLCQILTGLVGGTDCSPTALAAAAKCYKCVPKGWQKAVQTYLLCQWSEGGTSICSHPIVVDWLARIAADFVPRPSDDTIRAVCDFCLSLDIAGITDKVLALNPVIPDSILSMPYPLIYTVGNGHSPWRNQGFIAGDLTADGIQGDGTSWMDTGFNPSASVLATDDGGMSVYESGAQVGGNPDEVELGTYDSGTATAMVMSCWNAAASTCSMWNTGYNHIQADTPSFYNANRTANNLVEGWRYPPLHSLGSSVVDQSLVSLPDHPVFFMCLNNDGIGEDNFSTKNVSFAAITTKLTAQEIADLYEAVYWMRFAFGGGYV
jgi:hypothetical protein